MAGAMNPTHLVDARGYRLHVLPDETYERLYAPLSHLLPDTFDIAVIDSELESIQSVFTSQLTGLLEEKIDFYFPYPAQRIRLMYVYVTTEKFFCPEMADAMVKSLEKGGNQWFAEVEFEGGSKLECWENFFCHSRNFYFQSNIGDRFCRRIAVEPRLLDMTSELRVDLA